MQVALKASLCNYSFAIVSDPVFVVVDVGPPQAMHR